MNDNIKQFLDSPSYENQLLGVTIALNNKWLPIDIVKYVLHSQKGYNSKEDHTSFFMEKSFIGIYFCFEIADFWDNKIVIDAGHEQYPCEDLWKVWKNDQSNCYDNAKKRNGLHELITLLIKQIKRI